MLNNARPLFNNEDYQALSHYLLTSDNKSVAELLHTKNFDPINKDANINCLKLSVFHDNPRVFLALVDICKNEPEVETLLHEIEFLQATRVKPIDGIEFYVNTLLKKGVRQTADENHKTLIEKSFDAKKINLLTLFIENTPANSSEIPKLDIIFNWALKNDLDLDLAFKILEVKPALIKLIPENEKPENYELMQIIDWVASNNLENIKNYLPRSTLRTKEFKGKIESLLVVMLILNKIELVKDLFHTLTNPTLQYNVYLEQVQIAAAECGHLELLKWASNIRCTLDVKNSEGDDLVIIAAQHGHTHILTYLVEEHCNLAESKDSRGFNALMLAMRNGHFETSTYLVKAQQQTLDFEVESIQTMINPITLAAAARTEWRENQACILFGFSHQFQSYYDSQQYDKAFEWAKKTVYANDTTKKLLQDELSLHLREMDFPSEYKSKFYELDKGSNASPRQLEKSSPLLSASIKRSADNSKEATDAALMHPYLSQTNS